MLLIAIIFFSSYDYCNYSYAKSLFCAGAEWIESDSQSLSAGQKLFIKKLYLQTAQDASIFSGNPIIPEKQRDFESYVPIIDNLYAQSDEINMPIYFIFKIAEMENNKIPSTKIALYKTAVSSQLQKIGAFK